MITLLLAILASSSSSNPAAVAAQESGGERRVHEEKLDDPPAARRAVDDPTARTPAARLVIGGSVSVQVNVDGTGQNVVGDAANEPSIAVDPNDPSRIVIGWRQFDSIASNFREAGYAYSTNGGASWTAGVIQNGAFRTDPVLGFDSQGRVYYQSLDGAFLNQVFTSQTGGMSWGNAVSAYGGDKNWMVVDKSGGTGDGHVYGIWQRFFACCDPFTFTRSIDGAQSFQSPVMIPFHPSFGTLAVGPSGEVYAAGIDATSGQDFDTFVLGKSTNAANPGATPTFSGSIVLLGGSMAYGTTPNPDGLAGQANVAVDPSSGPSGGNVYVVASVNPPGSDPLDVHFVRSTNGGASWSPPLRINDDPLGNGAFQWFAAVDVAPNGRIDVIWNDTRASGQANVCELYYSWSFDGGSNWQGNQPVSPPFNSHLGWPNQQKLGDYYTLVSDSGGADVAYAATFNGEQDVYYLRLEQDCTQSGPGSAFCFGDGSGTPCPCSNEGASGHGCANGAHPEGALLGTCGSASVVAGDLVLVGRSAVPSQTGLYFQGDVALGGGNGLPFRDGLRCAGSTVVRLQIVPADSNGDSQTSIDIASKGGATAGETLHYQLWYRDPASSPCGTGSNLSNGMTIVWMP